MNKVLDLMSDRRLMKLSAILSLIINLRNKKTQLLPNDIPMCLLMANFVNSVMKCITFTIVRPLILTAHFSLLRNSQTFFSKKITLCNIKLNIAVSICDVNYYMSSSKCPPIADTRACSRLRMSLRRY